MFYAFRSVPKPSNHFTLCLDSTKMREDLQPCPTELDVLQLSMPSWQTYHKSWITTLQLENLFYSILFWFCKKFHFHPDMRRLGNMLILWCKKNTCFRYIFLRYQQRLFVTIICHLDELSLSLTWLDCLQRDYSELFAEINQINLFYSHHLNFHVSI